MCVESLVNNKRLKRIEWVDVYKGIMIILVVVGHATGKFNWWIYQFHMAAFFFVSGFLSNIESRLSSSIVVKKFLSIMLPLISLGVLGDALNYILSKLGWHEILFGFQYLGFFETLRQYMIGRNFIQYWGTFWFLTVLFGVEVLQVLLYQLNGKRINGVYFTVSILLLCLGYWHVKNGIAFVKGMFDFDLIFIAQFYFNIGLMSHKYNILGIMNSKRRVAEAVTFFLSVFVIFWGKQNKIVVDFAGRKFNYIFAEPILALASICVIYILSDIIARNFHQIKRFFAFIGKNSLGIMIFHFGFFKIFMGFLYKIGIATADQINFVILPEELSAHYWIPLMLFAISFSLLLWIAIKKITIFRVLLGQDAMVNNKLATRFCECGIVKAAGKICIRIEDFWDWLYDFVKKHILFSVSCVIVILLFSIPMLRTGIIINDELQARLLAMQGFATFYKTDFNGWIGQGRLLAAPINSFTMYLSFIGAKYGTVNRIGSVIILLGDIFAFGILIYKLFKNKCFAVFCAVIVLACMPIAFEHTAPNAFVGFLALPFMMILISAALYIDYMETKKIVFALVSMALFFISMMSYEAFITYVLLYVFIAVGLNIRNEKKILFIQSLIPIFVAVLFLISYVVSSKIAPSHYEGNQLGFESIRGPLAILKNLFVVSTPGFFIWFPRYQHLKKLYYNLEAADYIRIGLFTMAIVMVSYIIIKEQIDDHKDDNQEKKGLPRGLIGHIFVLACGLSYMIIPSLPNSIASMYQGNVGFTGGFLALPVTYFEYFAASFVMAYLIWMAIRVIGGRFYLVFLVIIGLLVANIQQMNDIISKEQNDNFNRLKSIEHFLGTEEVRSLPAGNYCAPDLYKGENLLAIHDGYWSQYCNSILGLEISLNKEHIDSEVGNIFYDGDLFVVVSDDVITIESNDMEEGRRAIRISDDASMIFDFDNADYSKGWDTSCYVYQMHRQ